MIIRQILMNHDLELAFQLFFACFLGGLIGWNRERIDRPAGFRTMMLIALGSTLATLVSVYGFTGFESVNKDPGRIAAQILPAVGFLGMAGIIKEGNNIKGLTTAASILVVAAIGISVGVGLYITAIIATLLALVILSHKLDVLMFKSKDNTANHSNEEE